jgi:hypothetical protein
VQDAILLFQLEHDALGSLQRSLALGDVLVRRDPAAARHRAMADMEGAAILQLHHRIRRRVGDVDRAAPFEIVVGAHLRERAGRMAQVDDLAQRDARDDDRRVELIHLDIALVADDQPLRSVEEAQALRHVVEREVEAQVLDRVLVLLAGAARHF